MAFALDLFTFLMIIALLVGVFAWVNAMDNSLTANKRS